MTTGLAGRRVVVTRPRDQAAALAAALRAAGAVPIVFPTIRIVPVADPRLDDTLAALKGFEWIVFTSANAVTCFCDQLDRQPPAARLAGSRIAAVGPGTADQLAQLGLRPALTPASHSGAALAEALGAVAGLRVLWPRSRRGLDTLPRALARRGAAVTDLVVYDTITAAPDAEGLAAIRRGVDVVTFASPSAIDGWTDLLGLEARPLLAGAILACIGPATAEAARRHGVRVDVVATDHTVAGLVDALTEHFVQEPA